MLFALLFWGLLVGLVIAVVVWIVNRAQRRLFSSETSRRRRYPTSLISEA
jgi:hypothetical protein